MINAQLHTKDAAIATTSDTWRDDILQRGYQAFIFDCDGTLVESADVHFASFRAAAKEQGYKLNQDWYSARTGLDRISLFQEYAIMSGGTFDIGTAVGRSISIFSENSDRVLPIPETAKLIKHLYGSYPLAVGTNAEKAVAEASLRATGLLKYFDHIVAVTDGLVPKPSPDIFLRASELLGAPHTQTLVIEDSKQGVAAAIQAGMDVIEITSIA